MVARSASRLPLPAGADGAVSALPWGGGVASGGGAAGADAPQPAHERSTKSVVDERSLEAPKPPILRRLVGRLQRSRYLLYRGRCFAR